MPVKVSLGKRLQNVVAGGNSKFVTKLYYKMKSLKSANFDFLSSRVKRVESCRFAKAKPLLLFPFSLPSPALIGGLK